MTDLVERLAVLRDEVLDAAGAGASDSCSELFEAVLSALTLGSESVAGIEVTVQDAVARRLAWGDPEGQLLADAEWVFDRLMVAVERGFRVADDRMAVIEAMTQVAVMVSRAIALNAVARSAKDRASRLREEMAQRQLRDAVEKQLQRLSGKNAQERGTERPTEVAQGYGQSSGVVSGSIDGARTARSGESAREGREGREPRDAGKTTSSRRKNR